MSIDEKYRHKLHKIADKCRLRKYPLLRACIAEFVGTAILVIFGCGVLAQTFLGSHGRDAHGNFISVSLGWGMAVAFGVFFSGCGGSGNINPAVTLAFALIGKVPFIRVPLYTISQILGAFVGAVSIFGVYHENIMLRIREVDNNQYLINTTGNIFVTNPWASHTTCFLDQVFGTAVLAAGALTVVDFKGWKMPEYLHPLYLGLLVYTLVGCFALNAGCALNPARDLGPRIMLAMCGWGKTAFTGGNYFFWIPIIGPYVGAIIGAALYEITVGMHLDSAGEENNNNRLTPAYSEPERKADDVGVRLL